ncbi:MAG: type VI secretion system baseplate subunit TssG [Alphaproteobacteria bacterium]|nr:type VI secretion system baseplate subunit TssG [Alphaproteobacteria bacterium]
MTRAAPNPSGDGITARLLEGPENFEFTTAIRLAERAGELRLVAVVENELSATPIRAVKRQDGVVEVQSSVGGLVGALGALPPAYTQTILEERRHRSRSLAAFLDIFAGRLLLLFVAACEKYRLARLLRWHGHGRENGIILVLLALVGLRAPELRSRNPIGDDPVLRFGGFFASRLRNASALAAMLGDHSGLAVRIEQFHPRRIDIPEGEQSALAGARCPRLGVDAIAGATVNDRSGGFRVVIGPVGYVDYLSLEPGSPRMNELMALTRLYVGPALRFDVQVILRKEEVPFCQLGDPAQRPRLGWNAWARLVPLSHDSDDAVVAERGTC